MFPKKIKILSMEYRVRQHKDILAVDSTGTHFQHGNISDLERVIDVHRGGDQAQELQVLFHEIVHGYEYALGLDLEDSVADQLASHLVDFFMQNKAWRWFEKE